MGTWGAGSFDSDDASDFIIEFERRGVKALFDAFDAVKVSYLEAPEAQRAIAAAEIVAIVTGKSGPSVSNLQIAFGLHADSVTRELPTLVNHAVQSIQRIMSENSELAELWEEAGSSEWLLAVDDLLVRLTK